MAGGDENIPSSLSFSSSSNMSNGYFSHDNTPITAVSESATTTNLDLLSLSKLSSSLEKLVICSEYDYSDAEIEVDGISLGIHRCILAARSEFFHELFKKDDVRGEGNTTKKPKYVLSELVPDWSIGYESFVAVINYLYTGKVKPPPPEVSTCVHPSCAHDSCGPSINYAVEMMYASATFKIQELEILFQQRLLVYADKAFAEDVIPIVKVASRFQLKTLLSHCIQRIARSDLDDVIIEKELPSEAISEVKSLRSESTQNNDPVMERSVKRIQRALDSDDVELLTMLLAESNAVTLDSAHALHYAAAYCNPKVMSEVLNLGKADVNLRNSRGCTVLHVASRRGDPSVILSLLTQGACVFDTTRDGRTAVDICRRLTRPKDFNEVTEHGKETNKDKLCIDMLDREMCRNPSVFNVSVTSMFVADDLRMRLLFFENRVAMARVLFPLEATLAMTIAKADTTKEFRGLMASKGSYGDFADVDSNDQVWKLQQRLQSLQGTVETGRRFFPNCSEFLDRLLEDDTLGPLMLEKGTSEEQNLKKTRFMELKEDVMKAFSKDKAQQNHLAGQTSASSCSSSPKNKVRRR